MSERPLVYLSEPDRVPERATAYASCIGGRRFTVAHQTPGTTIAGQTSFAATTPTFLISQASAARRVILSSLFLSQMPAAAGGIVNVALFVDPTDRYASGGTAITPQATMADSDAAAGFSFRFNPTATSAGAGADAPRLLYHWTLPVWLGSVFNPDLLDGVGIGATGSILLYTWAATTAPTWILGGIDLLEEG